jgi:predicted polyphosphate/ATP-dependent NAD kinase
MRNLLIVRAATALIAIGGGYGTLSEIALALKLKKPMIGLKTWDISRDIMVAASAKEAVAMVVGAGGGGAGW